MSQFSPVDGFSQVHESLTETITLVANEPSLGLFFVQHHAHNAAPILASVKNKLVDASQEAFLCTEDMTDALNSVKSFKRCGPNIIDRMIKNLESSVSVMSSLHQLRRNGGRLDQSNISRKSNTIRAVWDSALQKSGSSYWSSHSSSMYQVRVHNKESSSSTQERYEEPIANSPGTNLFDSQSFLLPLKSALQRAGNFGWRRSTVDNRFNMNIRTLPRSYSAEDMKIIAGKGPENYEYVTNNPVIISSEAVGEGSTVLSGEDVANSKEMDQDDQLPVSSQTLFESDDDGNTQIP
ncbi:uncharacterized protein LOC131063132 [Cryptomeria japonica]|uniref:uncharacterized protein LOC131063132 n=1 Tax=Cryptomeria japonica TaxID=3369 RepID=UPI0027D9F590|nr:uncharacterized protein LOC131063132 [Cryptomeria japonica]XP_057852880.2 uncharacterized protein LOC131063132 [Cryptomeria japonica]